jgi:hypothetical protein
VSLCPFLIFFFYAVRVISKEIRRLVIPRNYSFVCVLYLICLFENVKLHYDYIYDTKQNPRRSTSSISPSGTRNVSSSVLYCNLLQSSSISVGKEACSDKHVIYFESDSRFGMTDLCLKLLEGNRTRDTVKKLQVSSLPPSVGLLSVASVGPVVKI